MYRPELKGSCGKAKKRDMERWSSMARIRSPACWPLFLRKIYRLHLDSEKSTRRSAMSSFSTSMSCEATHLFPQNIARRELSHPIQPQLRRPNRHQIPIALHPLSISCNCRWNPNQAHKAWTPADTRAHRYRHRTAIRSNENSVGAVRSEKELAILSKFTSIARSL